MLQFTTEMFHVRSSSNLTLQANAKGTFAMRSVHTFFKSYLPLLCWPSILKSIIFSPIEFTFYIEAVYKCNKNWEMNFQFSESDFGCVTGL